MSRIAQKTMEWFTLRPLVIATITQAVRDSKDPGELGEEARAWLETTGRDWADMAEVTLPNTNGCQLSPKWRAQIDVIKGAE